MLLFLIIIILKILSLIVPLLLAVAFLTLNERKIMASIQRRKGPNIIGIWGLLQPLADGLKLILKETVLPSPSNRLIFFMAPVLTLFLSLITWAVVPLNKYMVLVDFNLGILYILAISSLAVYGIILAGWASNSKYAFLGSLRSAAQMISYEVSIGIILIVVLLCSGSLNLTEIVLAQKKIWFIIPLFPLFIMFFISSLAETNRPPFDLPEAEAELVAGYNIEYSSAGFALFFIGEYANIILMSAMSVILFLGGWLPLFPFNFIENGFFWFSIKFLIIIFLFIAVRAAYPRYRYDQLMRLGWKVFLPLSLGFLFFYASIMKFCDFLP